MKKVLCLTAAFTLSAAPMAFGQLPSNPDPKLDIYLKTTPLLTPESSELQNLLQKELENSRVLERVEMSDNALELEAPQKIVRSEDGKKLTVTFEITGSRGSGRVHTVSCAPTQLERCSDAIVLRAERTARELNPRTRVFD